MKDIQYTLVKIPIKEIINQDYNVTIDRETEIKNEYLITQGTSLLFDQIERLRGKFSSHINEVILIVAKKNPKQEQYLRHILKEGFVYNGIHYSRFGKSASQGKDGITAFVCDDIFDELYKITQMDIEVEECVISKYEAQRCLPFSSCTLIHNYMPNIIIIDEYEKKNKKTLTNEQILEEIAENSKTKKNVPKSRGGIVVRGVHDVSVRFSKCCNPVPGDEIVGFITRGRGISIHRTDCVNVMNLAEADRVRIMEADWQEERGKGEKYLGEIQIFCNNRTGLLADISKIFTERNIDVQGINSRTSKQDVATISMSFMIGGKDELNKLVDKIRMVDSVLDIVRSSS